MVLAHGLAASFCVFCLLSTETATNSNSKSQAPSSNSDGASGVQVLFPCPDKTIFLMPGVPRIPKSVQKYIPKDFTIDYSISLDHGDWCKKTTPEELEKHVQMETMLGLHTSPGAFLWQVVTNLIFLLIVAYCYKSNVTDKRDPLPANLVEGLSMNDPDNVLGQNEFHYGLCAWYETPGICLCACCCAPIRIADTMKAAGIQDFWPVCGVYFAITTVTAAVDSFGEKSFKTFISILACFFVMAKWRQELREKLGAPHVDGMCGGDKALDTLKWCCCPCCTIIQEAREIDRATGIEVTFPCSARKMGQPLLVGAPMMAGQR